MQSLFSTDNILSFFILVILELVLGIDNVIFVSIILNRLSKANQPKGRLSWMITGITMRVLLLMALSWLLMQKGKPIITLFEKGFDLSSLVMLAGGLFLIYKTVMEIHHKLEGGEEENMAVSNKKPLHLTNAIFQILLIDMVFSFDSIITAGGTAQRIEIMIAAVVIAMIAMFFFSPLIASFIHKHPTIKMLAMSFLVMIGFTLLVEGWDHESAEKLHLKNYVYFAMAFSFLVELLNIKSQKKKTKVVEFIEPHLNEEA